tara:strand:+ start:360 stop:647 length:288 start_codon:yes stop_codon:yes gene_type:complete
MVKMRLSTFEISDNEFDKYCRENRVGRNTARIAIRKMLEDRAYGYCRNLNKLSDDINREMHNNESAWALRNSPRKVSTEKEIKETQYKMFKGEKR